MDTEEGLPDSQLHLEGGASEAELETSNDSQSEAVCGFVQLVGGPISVAIFTALYLVKST